MENVHPSFCLRPEHALKPNAVVATETVVAGLHGSVAQ